MFKILALGALAIAAQANPAPTAWSWNSIVGSDEQIFHAEVESVQSKSFDTAVLVGELNGLLGQDMVLDAVYNNYLAAYNKEEGRSFDQDRQAQFKKTLLEIAEHNLDAQKGAHTWNEGVNQFTDMSDEEYSRYLTYTVRLSDLYAKANVTKVSSVPSDKRGDTVCWREKLTEVRDQGQCGSCYAFSAVGQLEAQTVINGGEKLDLSEQEVVDCSKDVGNNGCDGGGLDNTMEYLTNGVSLEKNYRYKAKAGRCAKKAPAGPKVATHTPSQDDAGLQDAIQAGTVNIAVDASCKGFQRYKSGILTKCTANLNHAVLAVGYNNEENFYDVKNSWGAKWGDKGFIKIGTGVAGIGQENVAITV